LHPDYRSSSHARLKGAGLGLRLGRIYGFLRHPLQRPHDITADGTVSGIISFPTAPPH
jgi:hypothetical protein